WRVCLDSAETDYGRIRDIDFYDENNGIAVGLYSLLLRTTDGGETWIYQMHYDEKKGHDVYMKAWFCKPNEAVIFTYVQRNILKYTEKGTAVREIADNGFSLYPNPAEDYIYIETKWEISEFNSDIKCVDAMGRVYNIPIISESSRIKLDIYELMRGIYYIQIQNGQELIRTKFIKI
ncbi:MAG: T9SS type A sorting domain-containing protein, partial [Candidatus Kapaibacterium sp.]